MTRFSCVMIVAVAAALLAAPAWAAVPWPANCWHQWINDQCPSEILACPSGDACRLQLIIRDQFNQPMPFVPVTITLNSECTLNPCTARLTKVTDANGYVEIGIAAGIDVTAHVNGCWITVTVTCLGVIIYQVTYLGVTVDYDASGYVDNVDYAYFGSHWHQAFVTSDLNCDGYVGNVDYAVFGSHWHAYCPQ